MQVADRIGFKFSFNGCCTAMHLLNFEDTGIQNMNNIIQTLQRKPIIVEAIYKFAKSLKIVLCYYFMRIVTVILS